MNIKIPWPINVWAIMVQVSIVSMELSVEDTFTNELYKKYESLKKVLIPKPEYFLLINELKHLNEQSSTKSHQAGYYILSKFIKKLKKIKLKGNHATTRILLITQFPYSSLYSKIT